MKTNGNKDKPKRSKFIFLGLGLGVLALSGFGFWYFKGRKGSDTSQNDNDMIKQLSQENLNESKPKTKPKTEPKKEFANANDSTPPKEGSNTPPSTLLLKKGSKGEYVKQLQQALIKKYGKSILPKYGVDGDFGSELENALKSKGYPVIVDLATFNKIVSPESEAPTSPSNLDSDSKNAIDIAKNIWLYSTTKKLQPLLDTLSRIKDVSHYVKVNELFKTIRLGVARQTIVNGTLSSFSDDTSRQFIKNEFIRIGLKYNGEKWSLSGLEGKRIQTNRNTIVYGADGTQIKVPSQTILGFMQNKGHHHTRFKSLNNQILYVPTKHIRYV